MEEQAGGFGPGQARVHRRDLHQDRHGPAPGPGLEGGTPEGKAPAGHRKTSTLVAGLRSDRVAASRVVEGATDGGTFLDCVKGCPAPTLKPGDIVVMDNLSCCRSAAVREAIGATGAELRFLPPCSPDLNPIEMVFAKLKHWLRNAEEQNREKLQKTACDILKCIKPGECANYLRHAGYVAA